MSSVAKISSAGCGCWLLNIVVSALLWSVLTVGGVVRVACQGFLVREACVGVLEGGAGFLLSGVQ